MFLPLPGRLFRRSEKQPFVNFSFPLPYIYIRIYLYIWIVVCCSNYLHLFVLNEFLFVQYFYSHSFLLFVVYSSWIMMMKPIRSSIVLFFFLNWFSWFSPLVYHRWCVCMFVREEICFTRAWYNLSFACEHHPNPKTILPVHQINVCRLECQQYPIRQMQFQW